MKDTCPLCGKELKGWGPMERLPLPSAVMGSNPRIWKCPHCGGLICDKPPVTA